MSDGQQTVDGVDSDTDLGVDIDLGAESSSESESQSGEPSFAMLLLLNPVLQLLTAMLAVSVAGWTVSTETFLRRFVLTLPALDPWYSPLLSTFAHLDFNHFTANATMFVVVGGLVSLWASRVRFLLFFVITGCTSSIVQVQAAAALSAGNGGGVIGASGAVLGFAGYLVTGSGPARSILSAMSRRAAAVIVIGLAIGITVYFSSSQSAIISHFVGVVLGLVAGRFDLLTPRRSD